MERYLATPESIRKLNEFRRNRKSQITKTRPDFLAKDELREAIMSLSDSEYTIPAELVPRTPS